MRWGLAALLGVSLAGFPWPVQALFAPSTIHKALFHLDEGIGASATDAKSGGSACLGPAVGSPCPTPGSASPSWTPGRYGSALSFDGVDDTVTFPHSPSLNWAAADDRVVIEAWIKPSGPGTIASKGVRGATVLKNKNITTVSGGHNYRLGIDESGNLVFSYTDTKGQLREVKSPLGTGQGAPISFNQWHWISVNFSHNSDSVEMGVDGGRNDAAAEVFDPKLGAPHPLTTTAPLSIGSFGGGPPFFKGVIDELRISITPDGWVSGSPHVGSDGGIVISRVEFNPPSGNQFIELYRPDFRDGAGPILLMGARILNSALNEYHVPSSGAGCSARDLSCYWVSPGETVRIWLNGTGPGLDTASATFSEWYTSNAVCCTLGDGAGQKLGAVDFVRLITTGSPKDPDAIRQLRNADIVVWGGDQSGNGWALVMVLPEGLWPAANAFVATTPSTRGIELVAPGNNLGGPAAWRTYGS